MTVVPGECHASALARQILQVLATAQVMAFTDLAASVRTRYHTLGATVLCLRQQGWLSSELTFDGGRLCAEYRLTAAGRRAAGLSEEPPVVWTGTHAETARSGAALAAGRRP